MSRISESESSTMRRGFTRSNSATRRSARRLSSTSAGWKSVFCVRAVHRPTCESSTMSMPVERPAVRVGHRFHLVARFGKRHVQAALALARAFEEELHGERGLADAGAAFDEVEPVRGETAQQDFVEADTPVGARLRTRCFRH
jgi:hypothetical protein